MKNKVVVNCFLHSATLLSCTDSLHQAPRQQASQCPDPVRETELSLQLSHLHPHCQQWWWLLHTLWNHLQQLFPHQPPPSPPHSLPPHWSGWGPGSLETSSWKAANVQLNTAESHDGDQAPSILILRVTSSPTHQVPLHDQQECVKSETGYQQVVFQTSCGNGIQENANITVHVNLDMRSVKLKMTEVTETGWQFKTQWRLLASSFKDLPHTVPDREPSLVSSSQAAGQPHGCMDRKTYSKYIRPILWASNTAIQNTCPQYRTHVHNTPTPKPERLSLIIKESMTCRWVWCDEECYSQSQSASAVGSASTERSGTSDPETQQQSNNIILWFTFFHIAIFVGGRLVIAYELQ